MGVHGGEVIELGTFTLSGTDAEVFSDIKERAGYQRFGLYVWSNGTSPNFIITPQYASVQSYTFADGDPALTVSARGVRVSNLTLLNIKHFRLKLNGNTGNGEDTEVFIDLYREDPR